MRHECESNFFQRSFPSQEAATQPSSMPALTQAAIQHLEGWEISPEQIFQLLGVGAEVKPRYLASYRKGDKSLPPTPELMQRMEHIAGIADALRTTFPFSQQMRVMWLRKPHRRFQRRAPLNVMLTEGIDGLQKVRIEVDCAYGYAIADALQAARSQAPSE